MWRMHSNWYAAARLAVASNDQNMWYNPATGSDWYNDRKTYLQEFN